MLIAQIFTECAIFVGKGSATWLIGKVFRAVFLHKYQDFINFAFKTTKTTSSAYDHIRVYPPASSVQSSRPCPASPPLSRCRHALCPQPDTGLADRPPEVALMGQGRRITLRHQFSKERAVPTSSFYFCFYTTLSFILF